MYSWVTLSRKTAWVSHTPDDGDCKYSARPLGACHFAAATFGPLIICPNKRHVARMPLTKASISGRMLPIMIAYITQVHFRFVRLRELLTAGIVNVLLHDE
jgi:hypothetical protein